MHCRPFLANHWVCPQRRKDISEWERWKQKHKTHRAIILKRKTRKVTTSSLYITTQNTVFCIMQAVNCSLQDINFRSIIFRLLDISNYDIIPPWYKQNCSPHLCKNITLNLIRQSSFCIQIRWWENKLLHLSMKWNQLRSIESKVIPQPAGSWSGSATLKFGSRLYYEVKALACTKAGEPQIQSRAFQKPLPELAAELN